MESREEKKTCIVEKNADAKFTEDRKPWLSKDNDTLASTAVKLMLSVVASSSISIIAYILKSNRGPDTDTMCYLYVAVVLLWVALMSLIFFRFMWRGVLKDKPQSIKSCFAFGMTVNFLVVFSTAIFACATYREEVLMVIMLFIGVFNSMVMLMFHDTKMKKEEEKRQSTFTHKIFEAPKYLQVLV